MSSLCEACNESLIGVESAALHRCFLWRVCDGVVAGCITLKRKGLKMIYACLPDQSSLRNTVRRGAKGSVCMTLIKTPAPIVLNVLDTLIPMGKNIHRVPNSVKEVPS